MAASKGSASWAYENPTKRKSEGTCLVQKIKSLNTVLAMRILRIESLELVNFVVTKARGL